MWEKAKHKNRSRTEAEKKRFLWRVIDLRLRKCYRRAAEREEVIIKVAYTNVNGLTSALAELNDYLPEGE